MIYDKPYFTGKSRTITTNMKDFMTRTDRNQTAFMYNVGSLKVLGGMWVPLSNDCIHWSLKRHLSDNSWAQSVLFFCTIQPFFIQVGVRIWSKKSKTNNSQTKNIWSIIRYAWFLNLVSFSVAVAGWATRRRASEDTSTCWRRGSTMTGGCGEVVMLSCAQSDWYEQ